MHEQSLIRALLTQANDVRRRNGGGRILEVRVELGPLSGVEPLLLALAFEQLAAGSGADGARLVIDETPLLARCAVCGDEFEIQGFVFRCPACDGNVKVTRGDQIQLVSVTFADAADAADANADANANADGDAPADPDPPQIPCGSPGAEKA